MRSIFRMLWEGVGVVTMTSLIEAVGLQAVREGSTKFLIAAMAIQGLGVAPLLRQATFQEGIGVINFLWNILSTLFGFFIGIYFFKEKVHYLQTIGVVLSLTGLGLIIMAPDNSKRN